MLLVRRSLVRLLALMPLVAGCVDASRPLGGVAADAGPAALARATGRSTVLARTVKLSRRLSASAEITAAGGVIELSGAGVRLIVPPGAVDRPTVISVTASHRRRVAYEFQPHGLVFAQPVTLEQSLAGTSAADDDSVRQLLRGSYTPAGFTDDEEEGTLVPSEVYPIALGSTGSAASFTISHFSGYQLIVGRRAAVDLQ